MIYTVIYTTIGVPMGGKSFGPLILIRPKYRDDRGLLEHEKVHVRQWWAWAKTGFLHRPSHFDREVEAYREQIKWYPYPTINYFAERLANNYGFDITIDEARKALQGG